MTVGSGGRWLIETINGSCHFFDLDEMTYARLEGGVKLGGGLDSAELFDIIEIEQPPRVNSMFRVCILVESNTEYYLESSFVTRITALPDDEASTVDLPSQTMLEQVAQAPPSNAWLLVGDDASFPTKAALRAQRRTRDPDIWQWTCPRQIQRGDLVLLYFTAPRKAVHFAARALYPPVYDSSIPVNSLKRVDPHQWWTDLSPFVAVPAVAYECLKELHGGHLILRGRPTNYLKPRVVDQIVASFGVLNDEQRMVLQTPVGEPDLPDPENTGLKDLRRLAAGVLQPEAKVEQYVVEPLLRLCFPEADGLRIDRQFKIPGTGVADYVIRDTDRVLGVVEVKIGVRWPRRGGRAASPDLKQLHGYVAASGVPGLLIDANEVFLVEGERDEPVRTIERQRLTEADLNAIAAHLTRR